MSSSYLLREKADFSDPDPLVDRLIVGERIDGTTLKDRIFRHCTFANVSFKDARLVQVTFVDCVFLDCYFRKATVDGCSFSGNRFIRCRLPRMTITSCDFRYADFMECFLPFRVIEYSLPQEPNLREELATILAVQADGLGSPGDARQFRLTALKAHEEHLAAAVRGQSDWYRAKFPTVDRVRAGLDLARSKVNGILWGYGERSAVLLRNLAVLGLVMFPLGYVLLRGQLAKPGGEMYFIDYLLLSLSSLLSAGNVGVLPTGTGAKLLVLFESLTGFIFLGLFVSLLVKWIVRR